MDAGSTRPDEDVRAYLRGFVASLSIVATMGAGAFAVGASLGGGLNGVGRHEMTLTAFDPMQQPAGMAAHYTFARSHLGLMARVPCYCGCQSFLSHRNLGDCFVKPDGTWESHASGCGICTQESGLVERLLQKGRSPVGIRSAVIAQFGAGALPA